MAAPTVGNVTTGEVGGGGVSFSFSHNSNGTLLVVLVDVGYFSGTAMPSITFDGVSLTQLTSETSGSARSGIFYLKSPASGAKTLAVTIAGDGAYGVTAVSVIGADLTTTFGTPATAAGFSTAPSVSVGTTTTNDLIMGTIATRNWVGPGNTITHTGTELSNTYTTFSAGDTVIAGQTKAGTGSSVTMNATLSATFDWSTCAVAIAGAAGGGGSSIAAISSGYHQRGLR